jgi:hypothetical protein
MQGWGSILSLVVSTGALVFTGWLLRHEIRVRREEKADTDASLARLVLGQITALAPGGIDPETKVTSGEVRTLYWEVRNYGSMPIYAVYVWIERWMGNDQPHEEYHLDNVWMVVEDRIAGEVTLPFAVPPGEDPDNFMVVCTFADNNGFDWMRTGMAPPVRAETGRPDLAEPKQSRYAKLVRKKKQPMRKFPTQYGSTTVPVAEDPFRVLVEKGDDDIPF